jgi:putative transposase
MTERPYTMNPPKADDLDYIHFLVATQKTFTCTEAARSQPETQNPPAHDAFTRLLTREPPDTEALWEEAKTLV